MNDDGTPTAAPEVEPTAPTPAEPSTENIPGGEGTTPEEVAKVLNIPVTTPDEEEPEEPVVPVEPEEPAPETPPAPVAVAPEPVAPVAPETPETPSFALEVEDANGEKYTINPGDSLEQVLENFEPKSNGQIFQIIEDLGVKKQEKAVYDSDQAESQANEEKAEQIVTIQTGWDKEIESLRGTKRLPVSADGKTTERETSIFKYMAEENQKRTEEGRPLLQSFEDALDKFELNEKKEAEIQAAKEEKELAKKRGGLVGGSSAPASSGAPVYQPNMARNANQAIEKLNLIG